MPYITFCISNGRKRAKPQGLHPAQTSFWFDKKVPRTGRYSFNLPLCVINKKT